jgi:hypothetical protein
MSPMSRIHSPAYWASVGPPNPTGLDPIHPLETELTAEAAVFDGPAADVRPERLVDDDGLFAELRQDVPAALGQAFRLG